MLIDLACVGLRLVQNLGCASLIVQLSDILFPLVSIFDVIKAVSEGLMGVPRQEIDWRLFWPWGLKIILLHVYEFRMLRKFPVATRLEGGVADTARARPLSEVILWILVLIANSIGDQLAESLLSR